MAVVDGWNSAMQRLGQIRAALAPSPAADPPPGGWPPSPRRTEDVVYGRKFGVASLTLDVFEPAEGVEPNGIGIIAIISGGWFSNHDQIHPRGANWKLLLAWAPFPAVLPLPVPAALSLPRAD